LADLASDAGLSDAELLTAWLSLSEESGRIQGDLAAAIGVSPAQMSGIVERLRKRGLIEMQRSTLDRRRQVWRGTAAARQLLEQIRPQLAQLAERIDGLIPPAEQSAAESLCQRLSAAAEPQIEPGSGASGDATPTDIRPSHEAA
jgi:DNA-binding MarR family transcriptional regulator